MCRLSPVKIMKSVDEDVVNKHDGIERDDGLETSVMGVAPADAEVELNAIKAAIRGEEFTSTVVPSHGKSKIVARAKAKGFDVTHGIALLWDKASIERYRLCGNGNIAWRKDLAQDGDRDELLCDIWQLES